MIAPPQSAAEVNVRISPPAVTVGDRLDLSDPTPSKGTPDNRPPSLLGPWLAAGLGLAVLAALPHENPIEPAGAATLPAAPRTGHTVERFAGLDDSFEASFASMVPLADTAASAVSPIGLLSLDDVQVPASADHPPNTEHFQVNGVPIRPLPPGWFHPLVNSPTPAADEAGEPTTEPTNEPTAEQWAQLRWCESSNNYEAVNASGKYRGAYQFDLPTWESVGGVGDPAAASPDEQDLRALLLYQRRGSSPWPFCGRYLD